MGRNLLGSEKHRRCEQIGGRAYTACDVRGSSPIARCWFTDDDGDRNNYDEIDYRHREGPWPRLRKGKLVDPPADGVVGLPIKADYRVDEGDGGRRQAGDWTP